MASSLITTTSYIIDQKNISSYNRGPITTAFEAPASCSTILTHLTRGSTDLFFGNWGGEVDTSCYPTGSKPAAELITGDWGSYYYSPAICPSGWTTVTTFESFVPGWNTWEFVALNTETTAALCCPSGYSYFERGHQCSSTIPPDQTVVFHRPTYNGTNWVYSVPITTTFTSGTSAVGDGVPIWWQSSDAEVLARASALPTSISSNPSGLSTGAKIGIGLGIPAAVIIGLVIGFVLGTNRQRRRSANEEGDTKAGNMSVAAGYMTGPTQELDSNTRHELHHVDNSNRHELPSVAH